MVYQQGDLSYFELPTRGYELGVSQLITPLYSLSRSDLVSQAQHIEKFRDLYGEACPDVVVPEAAALWQAVESHLVFPHIYIIYNI